MPDIKELRQRYPSFDKYGYSDTEIINYIAENTNQNPADLAAYYELIDPDQGDLARGFSSGIDSAQAGLYGLTGLVGETVGADSMRDWGYQGYKENMDLVNLRSKPTDSTEGVNSIGDAIDFAQYYTGYGIPMIAEAIAGSKGAGVIAKEGTKQVVKNRIKKELGEEFVDKALEKGATKKILDKAARQGEFIGLGGQAVGQELGFTYGGAADEQGVGNVDLGDVYTYGTIAGGLELAGDALTLGLAKFGPAKNLMDIGKSSSRAKRVAGKATAGGLIEGSTEALQTGFEEMGAGKSFEEANFTDPTSFFAGAIPGAEIGAIGGIRRPYSLDVQAEKIAKEEQAKAAEEKKAADAEIERVRAEEEQKVAQEAQVADSQANLIDEHRYNGVFPDFNEFQKESTTQQMLDLDDITTDLGKAFKAWRIEQGKQDPTMFDINDKTKKQFLKTIDDGSQVQKDLYRAQLLEHAEFKEIQKSRSEAEQTAIDKQKAEYLTKYNEAVATGDLTAARQAEQEALSVMLPAEWREAKRADAIAKNTKPAKGTGNVATPSNATSTAQAPLKPGQKGYGKQNAANKAAEILGEDFAEKFPEIQGLIDSNNSAIYKPATWENKLNQALNDQKEYDRLGAETALVEQFAKEAEYAKEKLGDNWVTDYPELINNLRAGNTGLFNKNVDAYAKKSTERDTVGLVRTILAAAPNAKFSKGEQRVFDWLQKVAQDGTYESYLNKDGQLLKTKVAEEVGLGGAGAVQPAINGVAKKLANASGVAEDQIISELAKPTVAPATTQQTTANEEIAQDFQTEEEAAAAKQAAEDTQQEAADPMDALNASDENRLQGMSIIQSGGASTANTGKVKERQQTAKKIAKISLSSTASEEEVNALAAEWEAKLAMPVEDTGPSEVDERVAKEREDAARAERAEIMKSGEAKTAALLWNDIKSDTTVTFDQLTQDEQYDWVMSYLEFEYTGNRDVLDADQRQMETDIDNRVTSGEEVNNEGSQAGQQESTTQSQEQPKETSAATEETVRERSGTDTNNATDNAEVQQPEQTADQGVDEQVAQPEDTAATTTETAEEKPKKKKAPTVESPFKLGRKTVEVKVPGGATLKNNIRSFSYKGKTIYIKNMDGPDGKAWYVTTEDGYIYDEGWSGTATSQYPTTGKPIGKNLVEASAAVQRKLMGPSGFPKKSLMSWNVPNFLTKGRINAKNNDSFRGMKTIGEALQLIIDSGTRFEKAMAQRLLNQLQDFDIPIVIVNDPAADITGTLTSKGDPEYSEIYENHEATIINMFTDGVHGASFPVDVVNNTGVIYLNGGAMSGLNNRTILHEALHAATQSIIHRVNSGIGEVTVEQQLFYDDMKRLHNYMFKQYEALKFNKTGQKLEDVFVNVPYTGDVNDLISYLGEVIDTIGQDTEEFLAYGLTDPIFQQFLSAVKVAEESQMTGKYTGNRLRPTILTQFIEGIRKLFGYSGENDINGFHALIIQAEGIMKNEQNRRANDESSKTIADSVMDVKPKGARIVRDVVDLEQSKIASWIGNNLGETAQKFWDNSKFLFKQGANSAKFLHQFIDDVKAKMPAAGTWYQEVKQMDMTRNKIRQGVEGIASRAMELTEVRRQKVNKFISDSTYFQKWGYDPQLEGRDIKVDPTFEQRFNELTTEEQQIVKDIFAHGEEMRVRKQQIAKKLGVDSKWFTGAALEGPYAPLKRFGNYVVELKSDKYAALEARAEAATATAEDKKALEELKSDQNHYVVSFFDTMGAARQFRKANLGLFPKSPEASQKIVNIRGGANQQIFERILGALSVNEDIDDTARKAMTSMVRDMYFQSLDESNARQSGRKRANIAGYDQDMIRSFLHQARAESNLVAHMEHGSAINAALIQAEKQARADTTGKTQDVYNMLLAHYEDTYEGRQTPIQDRLAAANTFWMLTTSVGYHLTNATQPIMVAIPKIAGDFGDYSGTWNRLFSGYKLAKQLVDVNPTKFQVDIDINRAPKKYHKLLEELQLRQLLDVGLEHELAEFNRFDTGFDAVNKASAIAGSWSHKLYQVARAVEAYNRISTAIAAYDAAASNPSKLADMNMTKEEYAVSAVEDTQGNFSRLDAPLLLKKLPKITVQYRKYQMMMGWLYANATKQAFRGATPEERAMGKRTLAFALGHAGVFAGAAGMPLAGIVTYLLGFMGDEDEPQDIERWLKGQFGDDVGNLLANGVLSVVGIDATSKLSQANIFSPLPYTDADPTTEAGLAQITFDAVTGPFGSTLKGMTRAVDYAGKGNIYRAIESASPKGIRNILESVRLGSEGYSLRNGDVVADPTQFSTWSLMMNALGLPASDVANFKWTRGQQYELQKWVDDRTAEIRNDYLDAVRDKNSAGKKKAREDWMELQESKDRLRPFFNNDSKTMKRQSLSTLLKSEKNQRKRELKYRRQLGTN